MRALGWSRTDVKASASEKGDAVRWATAVTMAVSAALCAPALLQGAFADDILHELIFREFPEAFARTFNIFSFMKNPAEVALYRDWGVLPWWTSDDARIDFFRPIPSVTHWVDAALYSSDPHVGHAISIGWYVLSMWLVSRVLVRFFPENSRLILLAVAVFGLNGSHAVNVQWLAARNELIASVFLLGAFVAWLRWRERGARGDVVLLVLSYVAALLSKESAMVLPALLVTHALLFPSPGTEPKSWWARVRPQLPVLGLMAVVTLVYLVAYFGSGHGADSLVYINPVQRPLRWLEAMPRAALFHLVTLATGVPMLMLGAAPLSDQPLGAGLAIVATFGFVALAFVVLRGDRAARFFAVWVGLSLLQMTTTFPDARFVYMASVGFAYLVARVMAHLWSQRERWAQRLGLAALVLVHFVAAPVIMQVTFQIMGGFDPAFERLRSDLRAAIDYERLPEHGTEVFFINWNQRETSALAGLWLSQVSPTGIDLHAQLSGDRGEYTEKIDRAFSKMKIHYTPLSFLLGEVDVQVLDEHTVTIAPVGSTFFPTIFEQLYLTDARFVVGQSVALPHFVATIDELKGADVTRVRFTFKEPLNSARYRFMAWEGEHLRPLALVPGSTVRLALR